MAAGDCKICQYILQGVLHINADTFISVMDDGGKLSHPINKLHIVPYNISAGYCKYVELC